MPIWRVAELDIVSCPGVGRSIGGRLTSLGRPPTPAGGLVAGRWMAIICLQAVRGRAGICHALRTVLHRARCRGGATWASG
jgi:hypothetical protein